MKDVGPDRFRSVMGHFATGVTVVTVATDAGPVGMTANAVCSLSLEPLLLLVCFDNAARTLPAVREIGRFGVNVLGSDQEDLARLFASKRPEREKFADVAHTDALDGNTWARSFVVAAASPPWQSVHPSSNAFEACIGSMPP